MKACGWEGVAGEGRGWSGAGGLEEGAREGTMYRGRGAIAPRRVSEGHNALLVRREDLVLEVSTWA